MEVMKKIKLFFIGLVFFSHISFSQSTYTLPKKEIRKYYQLDIYPRGFDEDSMRITQDYLLNKPTHDWKKTDSLEYIFALCSSRNYDYAYLIFSKLNHDEFNKLSRNQFHAIQHLLNYKRKFEELYFWLDKEQNLYTDNSEKIELRKRIARVNELIYLNKWSENDSLVFPFLLENEFNGNKKGSEEYESVVIPIIQTIDEALRDESKFENYYNKGLSKAFFEYGEFLNKNLSYSDAYIAYSIARYYNRYDNETAIRIRSLKTIMRQKKITPPSIREIFPKQPKGLFNVKKIMAKRKKVNDSIRSTNNQTLKLIQTDKKGLSTQQQNLILFIGLLLILLAVLLFLRTKK
jgi:LPXTG-motif cell wall-anchored protein